MYVLNKSWKNKSLLQSGTWFCLKNWIYKYKLVYYKSLVCVKCGFIKNNKLDIQRHYIPQNFVLSASSVETSY